MSLEQPTELPRGKDVPDDDGVPLDSEWVADQTRIYLIEPLRQYFGESGIDAFVGGNSFVYYDPKEAPIGPDFYVVKGGVWRGQTRWVAWEESHRLPTTVIEFLSPSTEGNDRGVKFCRYRDVFRTQEYFLVDQEALHIEGYSLAKGHYVAMTPDQAGWYRIPSLGMELGPVEGWIRLRTSDGKLLLTGRERAEQEQRRADRERQRADRLARKLLELGIDPDSE
ncbi:MAG: Uma2 family endonuclease [Armatimonadetes bacterium]|nr:Uma2 family endonuclease [Armatimonadota bacterium]